MHRGKDAAAGHSDGRGSENEIARLSAAAFREIRRLVSRNRERPRRSPGPRNGQDDRPVVADRPRKSSGSETTFERDLIASAEIEAGVEAMADDVWAWCEKAKAFGRTVTVKVKFADFRQVAPRISRSRFRPFARRRGSAQVDPRPTLTAAGSED